MAFRERGFREKGLGRLAFGKLVFEKITLREIGFSGLSIILIYSLKSDSITQKIYPSYGMKIIHNLSNATLYFTDGPDQNKRVAFAYSVGN